MPINSSSYDQAGSRQTVSNTPVGSRTRAYSLASSPVNVAVVQWDVATGSRVRELKSPQREVTKAMAWSWDGQLVTASNHIRLWDLSTGELQRSIPLGEQTALSISVPLCPPWVAVGMYSGRCSVINLLSGDLIRDLDLHSNRVLDVVVTGARLLAASWDYTVTVTDLDTGRELRRLKDHKGTVNCLAVSPNGRIFATGADDRTINVYTTASSLEEATLGAQFHADSCVMCLAWLDDTCLFFSGAAGEVGSLHVSVGSRVPVLPLTPKPQSITEGVSPALTEVQQRQLGPNVEGAVREATVTLENGISGFAGTTQVEGINGDVHVADGHTSVAAGQGPRGEVVISEGWLQKRGRWNRRYKRRYFRLYKDRLEYAADASSALLGSITLTGATARLGLEQAVRPTIELEVPSQRRTFIFAAEQTTDDLSVWMAALARCLR